MKGKWSQIQRDFAPQFPSSFILDKCADFWSPNFLTNMTVIMTFTLHDYCLHDYCQHDKECLTCPVHIQTMLFRDLQKKMPKCVMTGKEFMGETLVRNKKEKNKKESEILQIVTISNKCRREVKRIEQKEFDIAVQVREEFFYCKGNPGAKVVQQSYPYLSDIGLFQHPLCTQYVGDTYGKRGLRMNKNMVEMQKLGYQ